MAKVLFIKSNYNIVTSSIKNKGKLHIWAIVFLCLLVFPEIVFTMESPIDAARQLKIERMQADYKKDFPGVAEISASQILKVIDHRSLMVFVDVRGSKEQEISMIAGAITERDFLRNPLLYQNYTIIVYCTIGLRSSKLVKKLIKKGMFVYNLSGGVLAWLHAGGAVYKDGKSVKRVHVYGRKWNLAPVNIESVW